MPARQKSTAPSARAILTGLSGHEMSTTKEEGFVQASESVIRPGTHAWESGLLLPVLEKVIAAIVIDRFGVHGGLRQMSSACRACAEEGSLSMRRFFPPG